MVLSLSALYVSTSFTDFRSSDTAKGWEKLAEQIKNKTQHPSRIQRVILLTHLCCLVVSIFCCCVFVRKMLCTTCILHFTSALKSSSRGSIGCCSLCWRVIGSVSPSPPLFALFTEAKPRSDVGAGFMTSCESGAANITTTTLISLKLTANRLTQDQETRGTESAQLAKHLYCKIYKTVEACWPGIQACSKSVMLIKRSLTLGLFYISCLVRLAPAVSFSLAPSALNPQVRQLEALWTSTKLNPIF